MIATFERIMKASVFGVVGLGLLGLGCTSRAPGDTSSSKNEPRTAKEYAPTGQTKTFELSVSEFDWAVGPDAIYQAIGYNGKVPGPTLDVIAGDHVVIKLTNNATEPHSVHTHVVRFANGSDGVKPSSVAKPGETITIEWDAVFAGSFPYHDHAGTNGEGDGMMRGLFGALAVHAPDEVKAEHENVVLLADFDPALYKRLPGVSKGDAGPSPGEYRGGHQYMHTLNGRAYEEWSPHFESAVGNLVRWRVISIGREFHTFHVHGHRWVGADGVLTDNINLGPGTYSTFEWKEDAKGDWLYHCHVPDHMEGGMMGLYSVK
jgi:manganese oxidase